MTPIERLQVRFYKNSLKLMDQKSKTAARFRFSEYLEEHGYKKTIRLYLPMFDKWPVLMLRTFKVIAYDRMTKEVLWVVPMPRNFRQAQNLFLFLCLSL